MSRADRTAVDRTSAEGAAADRTAAGGVVLADGPDTADVRTRLAALADAVDLVAPQVGQTHPAVLAARSTADIAEGRLRHGSAHTLVALAGTTGSGKSSLLNAIAGEDVAVTGVRRPTTSTAQALIVEGAAGDAAVLDWLDVTRRHQLSADVGGGSDMAGLVLLDLPDVDSVAVAHRLEADRLIELVDELIWVTDPQKYADLITHRDYLRPLAAHAENVQVVLNKADTLTAEALAACLADLERLLVADGLDANRPIATSTMDETGLQALSGLLAGEVAARRAMVDRVLGNVAACAQDLQALVVADSRRVDVSGLGDAVVAGLAEAVGVEGLADLVGRRFRREAALRVAWPPLRTLRRLRPAPSISSHHPGRSPVAKAVVTRTLRDTADAVADAGPAAVADDARRTVMARGEPIVAALDRATVSVVGEVTSPPRWWRPVSVLQTLLISVALVGLVWLIGVAVAEAVVRIDGDPLVMPLELADGVEVPLPTLLLFGGSAVGLVVGVIAGLAARVGAARRAGRVRAAVGRSVRRVADAELLDDLALRQQQRSTALDLLETAAGG